MGRDKRQGKEERQRNALIDVLRIPGTFIESVTVDAERDGFPPHLSVTTNVRVLVGGTDAKELEKRFEALIDTMRAIPRSETVDSDAAPKAQGNEEEASYHVKGKPDGKDGYVCHFSCYYCKQPLPELSGLPTHADKVEEFRTYLARMVNYYGPHRTFDWQAMREFNKVFGEEGS